MTYRKVRSLTKVTLVVAALGFLITSCAPLPSLLENFLPQSSTTAKGTPLVEITFYVQVPPQTPTEEPVFLTTLDEVTGLGVNAQPHAMEPVFGQSSPQDGLTYRTTLRVPQHSLIKYRYTRRDQYSVIEHTDTGDQVRYRMVHAVTPSEVRDVIYQWSDTTYNGPPPGRISGQIIDQETGQPIPGVLVSAGGVQAHTTADGSFLLSGLAPGVHNLVAYALDGSYHINQQGAQVASQANTEAILELQPREHVDVTFVVEVPPGTPQKSLRLAGNLHQLGNTFGNLTGGMNTSPARMPRLTQVDETHYGIILSLPVGAEIRYKYTMGDGFWNAEHTQEGGFRLRRFIVPEEAVQLNDTVARWSAGDKGPVTFDLFTPDHTPADEDLFIQFNPFGWTTPLPMIKAGPNHWVYFLYSPLNIVSDLRYRYCRGSECGIADDAQTMGDAAPGRELTISAEESYQRDQVTEWAWLEEQLPAPPPVPDDISPREGDFITGIEWMPGRIPQRPNRLLDVMKDLRSLHANSVVVTPTWTFTHQQPPVLEPKANQDALWPELDDVMESASSQGLQVALYPHPQFPSLGREWWQTASRDFGWWNSWFDQYRRFALHFADAAQTRDVEVLVLGGSWLAPALPGGKLPDGTPSGVPADAGLRWEKILKDVRARYDGTIAWAMPLPEKPLKPRYLDQVDQVHLLWSPVLSGEESTPESMVETAKERLQADVKPLWENWLRDQDQRLIISTAYPSAAGASKKCLKMVDEVCLSPASLSSPGAQISDVALDFEEQARSYSAIFSAIQDQEWITGLISRGYYPPVILHDLSISIHGKPAAAVVQSWFEQLSP